MKRSIKLSILALSLMLILSFMVSCSSGKSNDSGIRNMTTHDLAIPAEENAGAPQMDGDHMAMEFDSVQSDVEPEKVITILYLEFETTEFDETTKGLMKLIEKYKGYIENSNISYNSYYNNKSYKYGSYTIRVPKNDAVNFKTELNGIGNMISENTDKEDVTKQYRDTESRLKVVTTQEERILALLEQAENIEDIIALEERLSNIIYEKEYLQTDLMNIDDKVDFSTINVNIQEVEKLRNTENIETTFGTKIKNAIEDSIFGFKNGLENIVIWSIYAAPFLILLALVIFVVYWIAKRIRNYKKD